MDINKNEVEMLRNDEKISIELNESNNNLSGFKEINKSNFLENESSQSDGSKTLESREDRMKRLKEQSEQDRQRKLAEIIESQKQSHELRQKQQIERRKKIEELKIREEERRKAVEQRRRELDEKEKEKTESLQKRNQEREARAALCVKPSSRPASTSGGLMSQSMISPRSQARMSISIHSSGGTSSGSEKCTPRPPVGTASNLVVVPDPAPRRHRHRHGRLQVPVTPSPSAPPPPPEGFVEIEPGKFIPANTRHIGCFLPYRGPTYRVRGVLAWVPPSSTTTIRRSGSEAWWAPIVSPERRRRHKHEQTRARSAHDDSRVESIHNNFDCAGTRKDGPSPRAKGRSVSRGNMALMSTSAIALHKPSAAAASASSAAPQSARPVRAARDDSLFDRLSKPRSGSQPPKATAAAPAGDAPGKSATVPASSSTLPKSARAPEGGTPDKTRPAKKLSSANAKTSAPVTTGPSAPGTDSDVTEATPPSLTAEESVATGASKPAAAAAAAGAAGGARPNNKNLSRSPDSAELAVPGGASAVSGEEINYKLKLAEQRRIAREKKEEQLEEQRRVEEEARQRAAQERRRVEQETRQLIEEEARRTRLLEEERLAELEAQRLLEESERKKKEDAARELEEKRLEKLRVAEEARLDRKRRLEKIMSRVKRTDDSNSPSNEECMVMSESVSEGFTNPDDKNDSAIQEMSLDDNRDFSKSGDAAHTSKEESPEPTKIAWQFGRDLHGSDKSVDSEGSRERETDIVQEASIHTVSLRNTSPELLSDTVLDLPAPQCFGSGVPSAGDYSATSVVESTPLAGPESGEPALRFKSRLLQSMLGNGGRLSSSKDRSNDREKRHSSYMESSPFGMGSGNAGDSAMHHSRSYQADIGMLSGLVDRDRDTQQDTLINGNTITINGDCIDTSGRDNQTTGQTADRPNGHFQQPPEMCWSATVPASTSTITAITTTNSSSDSEDAPLPASVSATSTPDSNKLELLTEPASTCSQLGAEDSTRQLVPPSRAHALELS